MEKVATLALDLYYYARVIGNVANKDEQTKILETIFEIHEEIDEAMTGAERKSDVSECCGAKWIVSVSTRKGRRKICNNCGRKAEFKLV